MLSSVNIKVSQNIAKKGVYIPPRPGIIDQVIDCQADLEKIGEIISTDLGISAAVIKVVNSPVFGLSTKIASIPQAVVMLGVDQVVAILKTLLLRKTMAALDTKMDLSLFWDLSHKIAVVSSTICRQLNLSMADDAYTLGLFHNCGIPLLALQHDNYEEIIEYSYSREDGRITSEEFATFGVHHAAAGYRVSRVWNLPKVLCLAVKYHHAVDRILDDQTIENPTLKTLLCVLKMAENMVNLPEHIAQCDVDFEWQYTSEKVLEFVGLSEYDYDDLRDAVRYKLDSEQ